MSGKVICSAIGQFLRQVRLDIDESLFEMTQRLDMSSERLSDIEYGRVIMTEGEATRFMEQYCKTSPTLEVAFLSVRKIAQDD